MTSLEQRSLHRFHHKCFHNAGKWLLPQHAVFHNSRKTDPDRSPSPAQRAARGLLQANQERQRQRAAHSRTEARPPDPSVDNQPGALALGPAAVARMLPRCTRGRHRAVAARAIPPGKARRAARALRQGALDSLEVLQSRLAHQAAGEAYDLAYSRLLPFL